MRSIGTVAAFAIIFGVVGAPWTRAVAEVTAAPPAQSQAPVQSQTKSAAKSQYQNQRVCTKTTATGTLISKKTCKTQAQIDAERKDALRMLHDQRRTGGGAAGTAVISDF
jgi:hypothetical protein